VTQPDAPPGATVRELVKAAQAGDGGSSAALELLLAANEGLFKSVVARLRPAEKDLDPELVQEARIAFTEAVRKYDPHAGTTLAMYAWPFMRFAVLRVLRQRARHASRVVPLRWAADGPTADGDAPLEEQEEPVQPGLPFEEQVAVKLAVAALPEADQALIRRLYWRDQTQGEVAALLGVSQAAVSKRHVRILGALRFALTA
jgi:RNA polymerase sigma factor (sigma-70 family)